MPFCPKCGKQVDEDANFCSSCGHSLREKQAAITPERLLVLDPFRYSQLINEINAFREAEGLSPLSEDEKKLLMLPLFAQIEKNSMWFSGSPEYRKSIGYPETTDGLVKLYLKLRIISKDELKLVGYSL